jgi:hypothetical protein
MRQEILNELKFLLKEVDISTKKGLFTQDQDEVLIKIQEANFDSVNGIRFINLTDFGQIVNERSLASLISSIKDADLNDLDSTGLAAIKKLCSNNIVLVDEYGSVDPYFYVKCDNGKPFSAVRLGYEGKEDEFQDFIKRIKSGVTPTPTPSPAPTPAPTPKPEEGQVGVQGKNSFKCPNQEDVAVFQQWLGVKEDCSVGVITINAARGKGMTLNLQDYFSAGSLTPLQRQNQIQFCNSLKTNRAGYEAEIKKSGQTVRGKCSVISEGGSGKKPQTKPSQGNNTGKCADGKAAPFGIDSNCFRLDDYVNKYGLTVNQDEYNKNPKEAEANYAETRPQQKESKNYYDNKKLNEAKTLFNKLLKNL